MSVKFITLGETLVSSNTGLDAIKRAPIVSYPTPIRCLRIQDVSQSKAFEDWGYTEVESKNYEKFQLKAGDIIVARTGNTVGVNQFIKRDVSAVFNNGLIRLRVDTQCFDSKFIYFNFRTSSYQGFIENISGGTSTQPNMQINALLTMEIPSFPLPEQKAIALVLSSLDDKIDLLHRQNKTLEAMAETLFRQWFIEEAKEDWEIFQLQDLAKLQIGRTPPRKESHWFSDNTNDMKWVSIKDLGAHGIFVTYSSEYLPISTIDHFNIPIIPEGTVMLSFKMTVGRVGIAIENMVSNEAIAQFQIKKRLTSELLYCFLKQFNFDTLGSTSSIVTAVNTALLKGIEIALPEDDLIQEFTEQVKSYFDKVKANQLQIQTLENLRDTLLPKLMSGEVRVQYQTEEVA
ncbi:restriction endonuclease subunit S [Acinetobacter radioresistens]|uniref:restriction endonuclease subunit S n=1 Tax=Acinetobacter radioresistens TaxID=40216 RepID=UPI0020057D25|nr:restriction endonuclease subunit S [Acinetobacter radioresistens]MCK4092560.1 restriction endonuclease subunit S [Acinetobacter radioresistens]MCX0344996.1 restriction endonuclease subunit S [Acinetobacter radioresistens]